MEKKYRDIEDMSIWDDAKRMLRKARNEGVETAWDRLEQQTPHCPFCELGTSCRNCIMGPCRINSKAVPGGKLSRGVCGADADVIVARNFGRFVAGGSAGHSDHGRDVIEAFEAVVEGKSKYYQLRDTDKLLRIANELGIKTEGRSVQEVAKDMVDACYSDFGSRREAVGFITRVPAKRREIWKKLGITPRGVDR
jgi:carbon-monoxide dehydrogenase catalytic subunit